MFATSYINGFGFGAAPSLSQLIEAARARARSRGGFAGWGGQGLGQNATDDAAWAAFLKGGTSATFKNANNVVFCNKDSANRPQCVLNKFTGSAAASGPVANMQRAADAIMNLIPTNQLAGRQLTGQVPNGDGTTSQQTFTVPTTIPNPIGSQSGYDGVNGESTMHFTTLALTLAGMLKAFPDPSISLAFVQPERTDIYTEFSGNIASYLNDVAANFPSLLEAFTARGDTPVQTQLDIQTIPFVAPTPDGGSGSNKKAIIGIGAAMVGLVSVAAVAAGAKKPTGLYMEHAPPALGRGRRHRGR